MNRKGNPRGGSTLLAAAILAAAGLALARAADAQSYPGFWKVGNLVYAPCNYQPYTSYIDPSTGYERYMRYDFSSMRPNPWQAGQFAGYGGANHTAQWYGAEGKIYPVLPQGVPNPIGFYPGPPPEANLCTEYLSMNPGRVCPTPSTTYKTMISNNVVWNSGLNAFIDRIEDECDSTPPPPATPTPAPPGCRGRASGCGGPGPGTFPKRP